MRPDRNTGRASSSSAYRTAVRFSMWWLRAYTRSVHPRYTQLRESEVTFELWEHGMAADEHGWSSARATVALVTRTVAGMPRDRSWRRQALEDEGHPSVPAVRLLGRRHRPHFWVPLQQGHIFDQTNGMIEPERALPYDSGAFGSSAGNSPRML